MTLQRVLAKTAVRENTVQLYTTVGYFVAFVALGLAYAALGPTLPDLAALVGTDLTRISYGLAARSLGYLVGSVVAGRLYDLIDGHPVMAGVLLLTALLLVVIPLAPVLWLMIALLFLIGAVQGAIDVGGNTLLVWVHGDKVDPYMNAMHFFFGVGAFVSPLIIAQGVLISGGIRWAYWALALLIAPVALIVLRLPSPRPAGRSEVERTGSGTPVASRGQDLALVAMIAVFFFLYVGAESGFGGWIASYARATGLGDAVTAAYLTSAFWGALTLGRLLSIPLAARFSPRQVLTGDLIGCSISMSILLLWPAAPLATWVGTLGAGLFMASMFPTTLSLAERHMTISGTITSLFFVGASLGGMILPWVIGQFFERVGPHVTNVTNAAAVAASVLVFALIVFHTRQRSTDGVAAEGRL